MLVLLGAIGTATAPTALAANLDLCATDDGTSTGTNGGSNVLGIQGPFPNYDGYSASDAGLSATEATEDHNQLLLGGTYLFVVVVEDGIVPLINVSVDDEEGDADIESYADLPGATSTFVDLPGSGVDNVDNIPNALLATWGTSVQFLDDLNDDWDRSYYAFTAATSILDCDPNPAASGAAETAGAACNDDLDSDADGVADDGCAANPDGLSFITVTCDEAGEFEISAWESGAVDNVVTNDYICYNPPSTVTLTATPATVEAVPAAGNISHSLLVLTATDAAGNPTVPGWTVDWTVGGRCIIEALTESDYYVANGLWLAYKITNPATGGDIEDEFSGHAGLTSADTSAVFNIDGSPAPGYQTKSIAAAVLHCEGATPGVASVRAELDRSPLSDLSATVDVTVVGPPAFITMTAAPSKLICGEKATILVTVTDAINQKVSDHTVVELITNYGGVIGGTGATLGFPGINPVTPLSSGAAETFGGVATAYLLTSTAHVGSYEVVASAGGSNLGFYNLDYVRNGYFSTPVVTSQVTVTCTEGAPAVTAPSTGTGTISPPNTGDAGLAAANSSSNAMLYVIAGAIAFVMAGLASIRYARR
jgi:hypothetical protein